MEVRVGALNIPDKTPPRFAPSLMRALMGLLWNIISQYILVVSSNKSLCMDFATHFVFARRCVCVG